MGGLRDIVDRIAPPWLQVPVAASLATAGVGGRLLYSVAVVMDAQLDKLDQAILARFPTKTKTPTSLPYIGLDRLIGQGLSESAAQYGARLRTAFDDWFRAGSARALISQILGFVASATPRVLVVSNTSAWDYVPASSSSATVPTHLPSAPAVLPTANWNWDSVSLAPYSATFWWRIWVIVDATGWFTSTRKAGDGVAKCGDKRYACGSDLPSAVGLSLVSLVRLWKSQHAVAQIVVCVDSTEFIPTDAPGSGSLPDGTWGPWDKLVPSGAKIQRQPSRSSKARYLGFYR